MFIKSLKNIEIGAILRTKNCVQFLGFFKAVKIYAFSDISYF